MVEIITGEKGKGKTRVLLDKVHEDLKKCGGSLIFIDKNNHHMFDLDSRVRLINMEDFDMSTTGEFLGFVSGIISSNRDIEKIYLDSFLTTAFIDDADSIADAVEKLKALRGGLLKAKEAIGTALRERPKTIRKEDEALQKIEGYELQRLLSSLLEALHERDYDRMDSTAESMKNYSYPDDLKGEITEILNDIENIKIMSAVERTEDLLKKAFAGKEGD